MRAVPLVFVAFLRGGKSLTVFEPPGPAAAALGVVAAEPFHRRRVDELAVGAQRFVHVVSQLRRALGEDHLLPRALTVVTVNSQHAQPFIEWASCLPDGCPPWAVTCVRTKNAEPAATNAITADSSAGVIPGTLNASTQDRTA